MSRDKQDFIKSKVIAHLGVARGYLSSLNLNQDGMQGLLDVLKQPEKLIREPFEDNHFKVTQAILEGLFSTYLQFSKEGEATQAGRLIDACMKEIKTHNTHASLPQEVAHLIAEFNPRAQKASLASKSLYGLFKPSMELQELFHAVVWSDTDGPVPGGQVPRKVANILQKNPQWLFTKGNVIKKGFPVASTSLAVLKMESFETLAHLIEDQSLLNGANKYNYQTIIFTPEQLSKLKEALSNRIQADKALLGVYGPILDKLVEKKPYEEVYESVSPFQLILFFRDTYLLDKIQPFIDGNLEIAREQASALEGGGSDLVKIETKTYYDEDDEEVTKNISDLSYEELTQYTRYDLTKNVKGTSSCLQENTNALVLYNENLYLVQLDHDAQKVVKTEDVEHLPLPGQEESGQAILSLFDDMEKNSARRTTDAEHARIKQTLSSPSYPQGIALERRGICYKRGDDAYVDCKAESVIQQGFLKALRLDKQVDHKRDEVMMSPSASSISDSKLLEWTYHHPQVNEMGRECLVHRNKMIACAPAATILALFPYSRTRTPTPDFREIQQRATMQKSNFNLNDNTYNTKSDYVKACQHEANWLERFKAFEGELQSNVDNKKQP